MDIGLEKIDTLRERTGITYKEAKEVLDMHDGDVVASLIYLEEHQKSWTKNFGGTADEAMQSIRDLIKKGNVTKVVLKRDGEVIMNLPVTAGAIGAVLSPPLTMIGTAAALFSKCSIEVVKEDGEIVNINDMTEQTMDRVKQAAKKAGMHEDTGNTTMDDAYKDTDHDGSEF